MAVSAITIISCKLDDNIDPNLPLTEDLSPKQLLAAAETAQYSAQSGTMFSISRIWTNTVAGNYFYYAAPMTTEYQMNITTSTQNAVWNNNYLALANLAQIIEGKQAANFPLHTAMAKILLANGMQYIVDFYGDAPYSEAFKQQNLLNPKYDKGEDIYRDLVVKLNEALATLENTPVNDNNIVDGSEDVIFGGSGASSSSTNLASWKAYARTIKLRILLRQSKVTDATVKQFVNQQLATLAGLPSTSFVSADVKINPGYKSATEEQINPLYRNFGRYNYNVTAVNNAGWRYYMISDHFAKLLSGDSSKPTSGVTDPRGLKMYMKPVTVLGGATLRGIEQGSVKPTDRVEGNYNRIGGIFGPTAATAEASATSDGYMMLASESELLQAEAAVLYPQYFSNAAAHYANAVNKSFTFLGLTSAQATTYLAALDSKPVGWSGATDKMAAIQYQRLIILNNYRPYETYINYLKTGYPETPLALTAIYPNKPYRLMYPQSEFIGNSANVPKFDQAQAFTKNQYTPFWNRN